MTQLLPVTFTENDQNTSYPVPGINHYFALINHVSTLKITSKCLKKQSVNSYLCQHRLWHSLSQLYCNPRRLPWWRLWLQLLTWLWLHIFLLLDRFLWWCGILGHSWSFRPTTGAHFCFRFDSFRFANRFLRFTARLNWCTSWWLWATAGRAFRPCLAPCRRFWCSPSSLFLFKMPQ